MSFRVWSNEKLVVISTQKVASSFLDSFFYKKGGSKNLFEINNNFEIEFNEQTKSENSFYDLNQIFLNKSKKDILIVYRNPVNKYLSGLSQDFNGLLKGKVADFSFLIEEYFKDNENYNDYALFGPREMDKLITYLDETKNNDFFKFYTSLLESFFKHHVENRTFSPHSEPVLYKLYPFIMEKIKDKNKLYLIDIDKCEDNSLENFLLRYELKPRNYKNRNSNKKYVSILNDIIKYSYIYKKNKL